MHRFFQSNVLHRTNIFVDVNNSFNEFDVNDGLNPNLFDEFAIDMMPVPNDEYAVDFGSFICN